jgi:hypothetical protein
VEIDTYPAENFDTIKKQIIGECEKMASALKLKDGILHVQYRMKDGKPYIIEAMRRVLGNLYMIPAEKLTGINWDYWEVKANCGLDLSDFPINQVTEKGFYAYRAIMATKNGKFNHIIIPDEYKKYIFDEFILCESETVIHDFMSEPIGFLFFKFSSKEEMNDVLLSNYDKIFVE